MHPDSSPRKRWLGRNRRPWHFRRSVHVLNTFRRVWFLSKFQTRIRVLFVCLFHGYELDLFCVRFYFFRYWSDLCHESGCFCSTDVALDTLCIMPSTLLFLLLLLLLLLSIILIVISIIITFIIAIVIIILIVFKFCFSLFCHSSRLSSPPRKHSVPAQATHSEKTRSCISKIKTISKAAISWEWQTLGHERKVGILCLFVS